MPDDELEAVVTLADCGDDAIVADGCEGNLLHGAALFFAQPLQLTAAIHFPQDHF